MMDEIFKGLEKYKRVIKEASTYEEEDWYSQDYKEEEPNYEEDCFLSSDGFRFHVTCAGKSIGTFTEQEDADKAIKDWMKKHQYYPSVWHESDHGNITPYSIDGVNENNVTGDLDGGLGPQKTPFAFRKKTEKDTEVVRDKKNFESIDYFYKKIEDEVRRINEISYKDFKSDESSSSKQKINRSIKEISRKLYEIEKMIDHSKKLKSETQSGDVFWKSTKPRFTKIAERVLRISNKLRDLNQ